MRDVIIMGTGGHAKVITDIIQRSGDNVLGYLDEFAVTDTFLGKPVLGKDSDYTKFANAYFIIAIGNSSARERVANLLKKVKWYTAIHPTAVISLIDTNIGEGTVIMANAVVNPCAEIGKHCIINTGAIIEHDVKIDDYVHISVGAKLAGEVCVEKHSWVGIGATVKNGVTICQSSIIGAGAVVVKDILEQGTYIGVPAKKIDV